MLLIFSIILSIPIKDGDFMYPQLYSKTVYTLLKSALKIEDYVKQGKKYNLQALAITDEENVYGIIKFYQACLHFGIKPIIGITVFLNDIPLVLLAKTNDGYQNILQIATVSQINNHITLNDIDLYKKDIICIIDTNISSYIDLINPLKNIFREDLYLSLFPEVSRNIINNNLKVLEISKETNTLVVCLNEVKYLTSQDAETLRYLEAIDKGEK